MKKLILLTTILLLGCDNSTEPEDCAGVAGGTAVEDCFGVCDGLATIDECGLCTGGTTNLTPNYLKDECGVCGGDGELDICGICNGNGESCVGCTDPTACNFKEEYTISDHNSCTYAYENFNCDKNCLYDSD